MNESIHAGPFTTYRFFTVNEAGDVTSVKWIQCADDGEAQDEASALFSAEVIEVWDVERQVAYVDKPKRAPKSTR